MKQIEIVKARDALGKLCKERLPLPVALKLAKLWKETELAYEFQLQEEEKIYKKYKPMITEDGMARFETIEARLGFEEELRMLNELETGIKPEAVVIPAGAVESMTAEDAAALDGIVRFEEEEA